jgi:hypothetical protein
VKVVLEKPYTTYGPWVYFLLRMGPLPQNITVLFKNKFVSCILQEAQTGTEVDHRDGVSHSEVGWVSRGRGLKRIYNLGKRVKFFVGTEERPLPEFSNEGRILETDLLDRYKRVF